MPVSEEERRHLLRAVNKMLGILEIPCEDEEEETKE